MPYLLSLAILAAVLYVFYQYVTADSRRTSAALAQPFPPAWRAILAERVAFYLALAEPEKARFEQQTQVFLARTRITGVQTEVARPPASWWSWPSNARPTSSRLGSMTWWSTTSEAVCMS